MRKNIQKKCCFYPVRGYNPLTGFTLIELIIVVSIILILSSVGLIKYSGMSEKARSAEAYAVLSDIAAAENAYYAENNKYTATWTDLDRYSAAPASQNFDFTAALDFTASGYVKATHITGKGNVDYYMCIQGGNHGITVPSSCP